MSDDTNGVDSVKAIHEGQRNDKRFEAVKLKLTWGTVSGKWWGPSNQQPILCFHGWQDNCCVFDRIIPFLPKEFSFLALDIPGHGLSDSYPIGMNYGTLDMLTFVEEVRKLYDWKKIGVIAHSMMAGVMFFYASAFPDRTHFVISLDSLRPWEVPELTMYVRHSVERLLVEDERIKHGQEPPSYDFEELIEKIYIGTFMSVDRENCKYLLARGVEESTKFPNKYYFKRDARVKYFNNFLCDQKTYLNMAESINMPFLFLVGEDSTSNAITNITSELSQAIQKHNPEFQRKVVPGNHHFMLNNPGTCYQVIEQFLYSCKFVKNKL